MIWDAVGRLLLPKGVYSCGCWNRNRQSRIGNSTCIEPFRKIFLSEENVRAEVGFWKP
jgi:hypothetical protein